MSGATRWRPAMDAALAVARAAGEAGDIPVGAVVLDPDGRVVASGGEVLMISDPLHARRAASYWRDVVPGRAGELRRADLGSVWRRPVLLLGSVVYEVALRLRRYRPS